MFTECPGCQRQFHVNAAQLSAARGLVKCGFCGQKFNALENLYDKPKAAARPGPPVATDQEPATEPEFFIPEHGEEILERREERISPVDTDSVSEFGEEHARQSGDMAPALASDSHPIPGRVGGQRFGEKSDSGSKAQKPNIKPSQQAVSKADSGGFDLSEVLLDQPARKSGWLSRVLWGTGILLMILFAVSQILWFNRDAIMSRYKETVPWFTMLCNKLDCAFIRHRDPAAIELLNRDVRNHPRYKNALLVNATMSNRSQTLQAYPVIQLNLYNTDGKLIAYRQFQPDEYLDESINILQGMAPHIPVHFVLEVLDAGEGAVSFEFEFH